MRRKRRRPAQKFNRKMRTKLMVLFSLILAVLCGLVGRLTYIEHTKGETYQKKVLSMQSYDSKTIPYQRGEIIDRSGTVLATSVAVYNVILDCTVVNDKEEYVDPTVEALVKCFPELDETEIRKIIKEKKDKRYIVLAKKVPYDEVQPFVELQDAVDKKGNKVNPDIKGVWFEKEYQREYPYGALGSSIVGFTASGNVGVNGLEQYYNETLNGVDGREYGYLNTDNNFEKTIKAAKNGNTVVSTIDSHIQSVVEQKIADFNEAYTGNFREDEPGASHVGVLIMNPNNGDVLAMANYPNYDLSNPRDLSAYYTQEEIDAMDEDAQMDALNQLWQNFCTTYTYEPGSTAKPFTVAAGLETGKVSTGDSFYCDGYEHVGGHDIHCVNRSGHGMETLEQTLMNSCNDAMMQISYRLGSDIFTKYQQIFGFGQRTGIDLPGEARTDSLIYTADNMGPVDLATNAFGQNFNTTMIQLATAYCSLVNGGSLYQPHVVKRITDESGNTISEVTPTLLRETVSKSTRDALKQYMYSTVTGGTAVTAKVDGYSMGGKTGTAQKAGRDGVNYLVSFIGFAPVEDPQLVIYCVVDEPNVAEQFHSTYAQNIVREILEEVLPYMNIYRDEDTTGIHEGWGIKGEDEGDVGDVTAADVANSTAEESLDVPDTTDELPENTGEQPAEDIDPGSDEGQQ